MCYGVCRHSRQETYAGDSHFEQHFLSDGARLCPAGVNSTRPAAVEALQKLQETTGVKVVLYPFSNPDGMPIASSRALTW